MRNKFFLTIISAALLAAAPGWASDRKPKTPPEQMTQHTDPYTAAVENESRIIHEIRHELVMLPYYGVFDDLGFIVNGNEVTLVGAVTRPTLKSDAERVVKRVEGVATVVNNIEVLPLSPNDDRIRFATYRAIYRDAVLGMKYGYRALPSIHIIVKNGNVRLEGVVDSEMDRNLAGIRANGVSGVFSVKNDLMLEEKTEPAKKR